jgi:hypothetical protein
MSAHIARRRGRNDTRGLLAIRRSRVPCQATVHAGLDVERRVALRVTLQESPVELHESPVDEPYTPAMVLTGSSGPSPPVFAGSSAVRTVDSDRGCNRRATPASSPDAHLDDDRGVSGPEHDPDLRRPGWRSTATETQAGVARLLHAGGFGHVRRLIASRFERSEAPRSRVPALAVKIASGLEHYTLSSVLTEGTKIRPGVTVSQ